MQRPADVGVRRVGLQNGGVFRVTHYEMAAGPVGCRASPVVEARVRMQHAALEHAPEEKGRPPDRESRESRPASRP